MRIYISLSSIDEGVIHDVPRWIAQNKVTLRRYNAEVNCTLLDTKAYYSVMSGKAKQGNLFYNAGAWHFVRLGTEADVQTVKNLHLDPKLKDFSLNAEDNLVTLKNIAPNFDFQYFSGNPVMHSPFARRLNEDIVPRRTKLKPKKNKKSKRPLSTEPLTSVLHTPQVNETEHNQTVNGDRNPNH